MAQIIKSTQTDWIVRTESRQDLLRFMDETPRNGVGTTSTRAESGSDGWMGTESWEQAVDMFTMGWPEILKEVDAITTKFTDTMSRKFDLSEMRVPSVRGAVFNMGDYVAGRPDCARARKRREGEPIRRLVTIGSSCIFWAETKNADLLERAAAVAALVALLEAAGCAVSADVAMVDMAMGARSILIAKVKDAQDATHLPSLAFALGHQSMLRRIGFGFMERSKPAQARKLGVGNGYGKVPADEAQRKACQELGFDWECWIPSPNHVHDWTQWLSDELERLGFVAF
jgi:hypothetical protein